MPCLAQSGYLVGASWNLFRSELWWSALTGTHSESSTGHQNPPQKLFEPNEYSSHYVGKP